MWEQSDVSCRKSNRLYRFDLCLLATAHHLWSKWDGESEITSTAGHHITLVECDQNYKAVRSGDVTVTVNPGA